MVDDPEDSHISNIGGVLQELETERPANLKIMKKYLINQLDDIDPTECPCGMTRRAFLCPDNDVASVHLVDVSENSRTHYHKKLTEIYLVLEGEGYLELDGERVPVRPMTAVLIKPGCRHRAVGKLKIVNIPVPVFDPDDEWFDD